MSPLFLLIPILVPLIGGFAMLLLHMKEDRKRNIYSETVVCLTSVLVWIALFAVRREPVEIYSFTRGFSIDFRIDGAGALFAGLISLMWPLVMLYSYPYMKGTRRQSMFFGFYVMTYGVTLGIAFASNMTTLYVFYEMLTLVTISLVSYYGDHDSMFAGRKYAAYTIGGASLAFFALVVTTVYGDAGNFGYGGTLHDTIPSALMQTAFLFGFFGFGVKAAVFPLHDWLPTASVAPTPVTALLHAVAVVNSGVFAIIRLTWFTFGAERLAGTPVQVICLMTASFTLVFAAVMAIKERHFKRRLAWSTVSNLSYMLFGVLLLIPAGLMAGMAHMLFHSVMKILLFLCAGAFMHVTGNSYIYQLNGVGYRMPVTFGCFTIGALSLTGIPLFCGFTSKWQLLMAGLQEGSVWAMTGVAALIVSAFLCAMYSLTISIRAFFPVQGTDRYAKQRSAGEAPVLMLIPIVIFAVVNVLLGIFPSPVIGYLTQISQGML